MPVRQPDTDRFRFWEVAGAAHGPRLHMERIMPKMARDGAVLPASFDPAFLGPVPWAPVLDSALAQFPVWLDGGAAPSHQPLIEVTGSPAQIVRDANGNALGGVRVPEHDVTFTRNVGALEEAGPAGLLGIWSPLPDDVIRSLYRDQADYVAQFTSSAEAARSCGVLRAVEAAESIAAASARKVPAFQ